MPDTVKSGSPLYIDYVVLYQLLADDKFYAKVPAFLFMRRQGDAAVKQIVAGDCTGCDNKFSTILKPLMHGFAEIVLQLHAENPDALQPLVRYISARLRYRPTPVVLYYMKDGKRLSVEF